MKYASLALALALTTSCALPTFDVTPRYGIYDVDGDVGANVSGAPVLQNSVEDLGIDDDDGYIGVRADMDVGAPRFVFNAQQTVHDGSGTLSQDFVLDGTTITAGSAVDTDLDLGIYSGLFLFDFAPTKLLELGIGAGVTAIDLDFTTTDGVNTVSSDETLPIPVLAGTIGTELFSRLELQGVVSGMSASVDDGDVTYLDADAFLRFALFRPNSRGRGSIVLGYRWTDLDVEYDDDADVVEADLTFSGPYLGIEIHF